MDALEKKNLQLEQQVGARKPLDKSQISHSSPKKFHICSRSCAACHTSRSRVHSKKSLDNNDVSDDDVTLDSSYYRLSQTGKVSHSSEQVSIDFLENDDEIQRNVQRQLELVIHLDLAYTPRNLWTIMMYLMTMSHWTVPIIASHKLARSVTVQSKYL